MNLNLCWLFFFFLMNYTSALDWFRGTWPTSKGTEDMDHMFINIYLVCSVNVLLKLRDKFIHGVSVQKWKSFLPVLVVFRCWGICRCVGPLDLITNLALGHRESPAVIRPLSPQMKWQIKRAIKLSHGQPPLKNVGPLQSPHFEKHGYTSAFSQGKLVHRRGVGHSHWKVVWGRAALKTHFFRPNFSPGDPPFKAFSRSGDPTWIFWKKSWHFKINFCKFFETQILAKICSRDPSLNPPPKKKKQFRRPYFWKPGRHVGPTQIFGDYPPSPRAGTVLKWSFTQ